MLMTAMGSVFVVMLLVGTDGVLQVAVAVVSLFTAVDDGFVGTEITAAFK